MKNRKEWETKSLEWIHMVRKEMDKEIKRKGLTPAQWITARGSIDIELLCKRLGLRKVSIVKDKDQDRLKDKRRESTAGIL